MSHSAPLDRSALLFERALSPEAPGYFLAELLSRPGTTPEMVERAVASLNSAGRLGSFVGGAIQHHSILRYRAVAELVGLHHTRVQDLLLLTPSLSRESWSGLVQGFLDRELFTEVEQLVRSGVPDGAELPIGVVSHLLSHSDSTIRMEAIRLVGRMAKPVEQLIEDSPSQVPTSAPRTIR